MGIPFRKMHGLGNDFVVFDARNQAFALSKADAVAIADRRAGVGCDTIVILEPAEGKADLRARFINADGGDVSTCGNASRCIASLLFAETGWDTARIETAAGVLECWRAGKDVSVDMGWPRLDWREIPLAEPADTLHLPFVSALSDPVGVSMGNPHAVFFVDDAEAVDLPAIGPGIEHAPLFPERVNVEVATVLSPDRIRMRVWERGVGVTQACGSGACATLVAAARRGLTGRKAVVALDGGDLVIEWRDDDHVIMTGPAVTSFVGEIDEALLPSRRSPSE
jgi:diaminopimelate epimerase